VSGENGTCKDDTGQNETGKSGTAKIAQMAKQIKNGTFSILGFGIGV